MRRFDELLTTLLIALASRPRLYPPITIEEKLLAGYGHRCPGGSPVDSYLDIAYKVLSAARRPMSAKAILAAAHRSAIVPINLKGRTQVKTLQARLSEDILYHRSSSRFFRTEPGQYFLCELIADPDIPDKYKERFPARRRTRDLQGAWPLAFDEEFLENHLRKDADIPVDTLLRSVSSHNAFRYLEKHEKLGGDLPTVWTFSLVRRGKQLLSYRVGRYRDDREAFANKRSIGFPGAITESDFTLFSRDDFGIRENAMSVLMMDLDLTPKTFPAEQFEAPEPIFAFESTGDNNVRSLLIVMLWSCPEWFEPTMRRLSLNDPTWLDAKVCPNNIDDFEPWSIGTWQRLLKTEAFVG